MKARHTARYIVLGFSALVGGLGAETISWYSAPNKTNHTSVGSLMGEGSFSFQLGVFNGGFVPSASNISQWSTYWIGAAGSTSYNATTKCFEGQLITVTSNVAPFTAGAKVYVWGRSSGAAGDEWILFRHNNWKWPATNLDPTVNDWNVAAADQVILGTIHAGGSPFVMKSEAVLSYAQWRDGTLAGNPKNEANNDADHDGVPNMLEFALGSSPVFASGVPSTVQSFVNVAGKSYLQISIPRPRNRLATLTTEVSSNLKTWVSNGAVTEVSNTGTLWVVRDNTPSGPGLPQRFMRIKAVVQP